MGRGLWFQLGHSVHRRLSCSRHNAVLSTGIWRAAVLLDGISVAWWGNHRQIRYPQDCVEPADLIRIESRI